MLNSRRFAARRGRTVAKAVLELLEARRLLSTSISSYHGNAGSLGTNLTETTLTPSNVNVNDFGKLFSQPVDGQVYAQPLYQPGVTITSGSSQGLHNVVYVATENDSLYAFDSNTGTQLWQDTFLVPEAGLGSNVTVTTVPYADVNSSDISPQIGITSTPAIDTATGFLFLAAKTKQIVGTATTTPHYVYTLEKVNIASGAFTSTVIADTTYNTNNGAYTYNSGPYVEDPDGQGDGVITQIINGVSTNVIYFNVLRQMNRAGITLYNNNVYIAFASHGDIGPYHGWVLGYSEATVTPTAVFNADPDGREDGIWGGGGKIAIDASGNMYVETGNGTFDTTLNAAGFPEFGDYGDSFIKIALDPTTTGPNQTTNINGWGLKVVDYFTPQNQAALSSSDQDMGAGATIALPETIGSVTLGGASDPDIVIGSGKNGVIYLFNANHMGEYSATTDNVAQEIAGGVGGGGSYDTPALFYDGTSAYLIYSGKGTYAKEYTIANGVINTTPITTPTSFSSFGPSPTVSANGVTNGIVWMIDSGSNALRAYQADNLADELYDSSQDGARDALGATVKFSTAAVADGEVFVGTKNSIVVYGLITPPTSPPATPAALTPTVISPSQINLAWTNTATNAFGYYIDESTNGGTSWTQIATIGSTASTYSVTGLQPSTTYSFEIEAFNSLGNSTFSNVATATTGAVPVPPNFSSGFSGATASMTLNGNAAISGSNLVLTNGTSNQISSAFTDSAFSVQGFNTTFTFQDTSAAGDGLTFTIQGVGPSAIGGGGAGLGYANPSGNGGIANSVAIKFDLFNNAGEGTDSTGLFVDGDTPTLPIGYSRTEFSLPMNGSNVVLNSGHVMQVNLAYNGATLVETVTDLSTNAVFTHSYTIDIPSFVGNGYAYLGFTGASGGKTAIQQIQSWSYTVVPAAPETPTNLTVTAASGTELNLTWTDPYSSVTNFNVLQLINGTYQQIGQVAGTTTLYNVGGLSLGTTYYFEVVAVNSVATSAATSAVSGTTPVPPLDISNLQFSKLTGTSISLTWTDNANNATGIDVVRQQESNNSQYLTTLPNTATEYDDSSLLPGVEYDYEFTAVNLAGPAEGVDVLIETIPAAPTAPTANANGSNISLSWAPYGHAVAQWNIYRGTSSGGESAAPIATDVTTTSYTDSTAAAGVTYYYIITAVDTGGESVPSAEVSATIVAGQSPVLLSGPIDYLRLDPNGALDVYSNAAGTGTPTQYTESTIGQLSFVGSASPSTLVVDFSLGSPLPASGLSINGSTGMVAVTFVGTVYSDTLNLLASSAQFDNVPVSYSNISSITFNGGTGNDTLSQAAGAPPVIFASSTANDTLDVNGGTYTIAAPATGAGIIPVTLGTLSIARGAKVVLASDFAHTDRTLLALSTLTIAGSSGNWQGTLDLGGNDLDVAAGNLATMTNQLSSGYAKGAWTGTGIASATAAANTSHLMALGVLLNNDGMGNPIYGTNTVLGLFDGQSPGTLDVLIKYTNVGDANLDGLVDGSDYNKIDDGYNAKVTGWSNGDFNYDGTVDGSDYTLIDNIYAAGVSPAAQIASMAAEISTDSSVKGARATVLAANVFQSQVRITASTQTRIETLMTQKDRLDMLSMN